MATCSHPRKILRMPPDSFTSALGQLDPASRALLDLSLRRGMRTEEIADVLGAEPWNVALSRDEALRQVATAVGMTRDEQLDEVRARLAELPAEEWLGGPAGNGHAATTRDGAPADAETSPEDAAAGASEASTETAETEAAPAGTPDADATPEAAADAAAAAETV